MRTREEIISLNVADRRKAPSRPFPSSRRNVMLRRILVLRAAIQQGRYPSDAMVSFAVDALIERVLRTAPPAKARIACGER